MADPKKALSAWKAKYSKRDEEEEKKKESASTITTATNSTKEEDESISSSSKKATDPKAALSTWKEKYSGDGWRTNRETVETEVNKTSYLDTARNATKATISTSASKISAQDKDRRRKDLETELDDLNDRLRLNQQKQVGAMRGHASNLAKEAAVEYEEITTRISEINKELEMLDQPDMISYNDQLSSELEAAEERQAKAQRAVSQYSGNAGGRALASVPAEEREALYKELNEANAAVAALSRQQEQIDYLNKWQDVALEDDTFWNQTKANYRVGRITQDTNEAFNDYIMNPTEANKDYAYALDELLSQYQENNAKVLDDEGAKAKWISKTAAGYVPQAIDQGLAQLGGGLVGGVIGSAAGNPVMGYRIGSSVASSAESFGQMRGAAYRALIAAGMDDKTALEAANDEAFVSALIEGVGTYLTFGNLGAQKALSALGNAAIKSGSKNAAVKTVASLFGKSATDKLAKQAAKEAGKSALRKGFDFVGGLAKEAVQEYGEEALQESVSIANQNRENTGKWDLAKEAAGVIRDAVTGKNDEALSQIHEAGKEGAKISLMFGSVRATTNTIISNMANAKTKAERDTVVNEVLNDKESLSALIEEGKASGENSVSAQIAQEIESKIASSKEVTKDDVRRLIVSNAEYIKAENAEQATEATQSVQDGGAKVTQFGNSVNEEERVLGEAAGNKSVPYNVMSRSDTTRKGAAAPGYGEVGTRTFAEIVEESGRSADEVRAQFQTSYELGKLEMPREKVRFESTIQESAYNAGRQDAILSMKKAESKGATVWGKEGGLIQNEYSAKLDKRTTDTLQKIGKATGTKIVFDAQVGGGDANGAYVDSQGTIHIASDASNPVMVVVKHELTHRLQSLAPKEYTQFRNYAVQVMSEGRWDMYGSNTAVEAQQEKYYQLSKGRVNLTTEQAMDEIAADFTERILTDEKALNDFVTHVTSSEDAATRSMGQKFFQAVREFIDKVKRIFNGDKAKMDDAARDEYGVTIAQLEKAEQLWKEAYKAATERAQAEQKTARNEGTASENRDTISYSLKDVASKFQRKFSGQVTTDEYIHLSNQEKAAISHALKTGYGKIEPDGMGGRVNTDKYCYLFDILRNGGVKVTDVISHNDLNIHNNYFSEVHENANQGNYQETGTEPEGRRGGQRDWRDNLAASEKTRQGGADDRMAGATQERKAGGDLQEVQRDGKELTKAREAEEFSDLLTQFSLREKDPPKNVGIAYKVFYAKDGQLYPPMVANPGGAGTPVGVWLDADVAASAAPSKTGRPQVQAGGKGTNAGKMSLAFRPGWHLGDLPMATQFARKNPETGVKDLFPADFVWAECEYAMDHDYQEEAMSYGYTENGKFRHSYAGLPRLPEDGYYRYRTNPNPDTVPWVITGAMRVKRILTDAETDKILRDAGVEPMKRQGGELNLEKLGIKAGEQYSLKDSTGKELTQEQAEYFQDSKVRDERGNLLVVYHGTRKGGFTVFNRNHNYYTDNRKTAESYAPTGDMYEGYLNITKPYIIDADGERWSGVPVSAEVKKMLEAAGSSAFKERGKWRTSVDDIVAMVEEMVDEGEADYDGVIVRNVDDTGVYFKGDGKNVGTDYISFSSKQFKNIDNLKPTDDPDIRFSMKDSRGLDLSKEQVEYFKDSVIRDKNGNLMPMYHGTKRGGFTVFDGGKDYWYFTNDEKYAYTFEGRKDTGEFYPVVKEGIESGLYTPQRYTVYLNVKKPFVTDDADIIEDALYWDKTLAGELRKKGYDALMFEDMSQVIVLNANQIKNTTNKNPTDDPDIRYSLKKSVEDYRADLEAAKRELADHGERYFDLPNWQEIDHSEWMKKRDSLRNKVKRIEGKIAELSIPSGDGANIEEMKARLEGLELKISGMKNYNRLNFPNAQARQEFDERYANYQAEARGLRKAIKAISYPMVESADPVDSKAFASWFGDWKSSKGSKVVDADGRPLIVYHGTGTVIEEFLPEFTGQGVDQYGSGFYFTTSRSTAENYTTRTLNGQDKPGGMDNPNVIPVYLNIRKPIVVDAAETPNLYDFDVTPTMAARIIAKAPDIMDSEESVLGDYFDEYWERGPQRYMISRLANEYDWTLGTLETDIFRDHPTEFRQAVKDVLGYDGVQVNFTSGEKHFVAWFPNQIKHATENSGAYSKSDNRIKFSLKENTDLQRENAKLKEVNAALREQFKTTKFAKVDPKELRAAARKILKDYDSNADLEETLSSLDALYTYLANGEDGHTPVWNTAYRMAYEIAESVIQDASVLNDDMYREYEDLRIRMRTRGVSMNKIYEHDLAGYENLEDFRKRNFGRIKISKDATDVNTVYGELARSFPGLFDEEEHYHPADQLTHIAEVLESLQPFEENPFSYNMREATTWLANDIMERFFELPQAKPTFADKAERKFTEQVIKDSKKLERVREQNRERVSKIISEYREKVKETRQKEKAAKWEAVGKVKEHYKAKEAKMSESRKARLLRERISRHVSDLKQKLLKPTDKKHIPQDLQGAVAKLLESINQESKYEYVVGEDGRTHRVERGTVANAEPAKRTKAFAELQAVYAQLANELTVDPDLLGDDGLLNDVIKLADKPLADMTSAELQIVWDTLRAVEATVRTANKIHNAARWHTVEEAATALLEDNGDKKEKTELRGILGKGQKLTGLDMETPETFFHLLGNAGRNLFRMMRNSQDQHIRLMKEVADFTHETLGNVNVRKLESDMHEVTLGGEKVKLSTAQIMELYVLSKREQAIDHIFMGGILPDVVSAKGLKKITKAKPVRGITLEEVGKVVNKLTKDQRTLADKLQTYASTTLGKWGNQTSMKVYGYEKFGEKNYWPIRVNRQEVKSDIQKDTAVTSLANRSFTKGTKPHANNSLRLGSIFDTFSTHASEMATYSAWLGTLEDINRIRNYTFRDEAGHAEDTVKSIIDTVHGTSGNTYLDKLLADVTNGVKGTHGETAYMSGLVGNFKAAAVGANLRVIIQQPTAMLRAADMLGAQYMAVPGNPLNGWKKALKYAPIAQWKDWGYFDINTGRQMKDVLFDSDTLLDKAKNLSMWGAGAMDSLAWGQLWNAVEAETKSKHNDLKPGSDSYYEAVAARFTEIVDHTQVVDGILQRSQIMRSADGITKMATSFMGEPTKQYNMMMQAGYDARTSRGKDRKAAMKKLARTATVLAISGIANAMAQSIIDAVRDDDKEKEYWEKLLASFKENLVSTFNPVAYVPFAKDIISILQGYDVTRMDMESIEKLVSAGQNMIKALSGEGKHTVAGAAINLIAEVARLVGVPVANLKREITSFSMLAAVESDNYLMQYRMEKWMLNMNNSTNRSTFTDILYKAYKNDKEAFEIIYADMLEEDKFRRVNDEGEVTTTADYIASALNGRVIDDLFALYNSDQTAYKEMYNDLVKRDFLRKGDKSTADIINDAMETRMKKDQGVDGVTDLEQRYYSPTDQIRYDNIMGSVQKSGLWSAATEKQRDNLRGDIHEYLTGDSKAAQEMVEDMNDARNYGIDETEYLLWNLALEMYDTPSDSGEYGSYNTREKADALAAMTTLGDKEKAYLWSTKTTSDEVWDAFDAGVDIGDYVDFKAGLSELESGVDYKKGDTDSRKRAVNNLLDALGITGADRYWLYHTEYKK